MPGDVSTSRMEVGVVVVVPRSEQHRYVDWVSRVWQRKKERKIVVLSIRPSIDYVLSDKIEFLSFSDLLSSVTERSAQCQLAMGEPFLPEDDGFVSGFVGISSGARRCGS